MSGRAQNELTLRAEEVVTVKVHVNDVDHSSKKKVWVLPKWITTGMPYVRRCVKASKEKTGKICVRPAKK